MQYFIAMGQFLVHFVLKNRDEDELNDSYFITVI